MSNDKMKKGAKKVSELVADTFVENVKAENEIAEDVNLTAQESVTTTAADDTSANGTQTNENSVSVVQANENNASGEQASENNADGSFADSATAPPPKKKDKTVRRVLSYFKKYYPVQTVIIAIGFILSAVASISASVFLQQIVDTCIVPGIQLGYDAIAPRLYSLLGIMGTIYGVGVLSVFTASRLLATIAQGVLTHLRTDMFETMESLPIRYFDTNERGDIMSRYTNDTDSLIQFISQSMPQLLVSSLTAFSLFVVMCVYSLWLTLVMLLGVVVMMLVTKKVAGGSSKYFTRQQRSMGATEGYIEEIMNGQKVVKVFCHEPQVKRQFDAINDNLRNDSEKANKYANILMPILNNFGFLLYVIVATLGGVLLLLNAKNVTITGINVITLGVIVSFLTMSRQFTMSISQVSQQVNAVVMGIAGAKRVFSLIDETPEHDDGYVTLVHAEETADGYKETDSKHGVWSWKHPHKDGTVTYTPVRGEIVLDHVDFGYNSDKIVLHDVTMYAKPGQKIALVGSTGAGKTTITNLINRFYDIADGKVRYDGININKIKKSELRRSIGVVLQDVNLFTGTVMENIRYGRPDATDEEVYSAAKLAAADDFISRLPEGYSTMLTVNGSNLSQGQCQLISIARAAIADAPVMILDEATSSIDTRTEALVQRGMDNLMLGRTVFVIAHRLSTIRNSDAIIVLDHGRIIERGSHDELIKQKGTYYKLYTGVFELE